MDAFIPVDDLGLRLSTDQLLHLPREPTVERLLVSSMPTTGLIRGFPRQTLLPLLGGQAGPPRRLRQRPRPTAGQRYMRLFSKERRWRPIATHRHKLLGFQRWSYAELVSQIKPPRLTLRRRRHPSASGWPSATQPARRSRREAGAKAYLPLDPAMLALTRIRLVHAGYRAPGLPPERALAVGRELWARRPCAPAKVWGRISRGRGAAQILGVPGGP